MTEVEMWDACAHAALMLDIGADDWQALGEVEDTLWPLASELTEGATALTAYVKSIGDVRALKGCLVWVQRHRYDALETELRAQLDIALRCALRVLDRSEAGQPAYGRMMRGARWIRTLMMLREIGSEP